MAQRRRAASRTKTKTAGKRSKAAKPVVKRAKAKTVTLFQTPLKAKAAAKSAGAAKSKPATKSKRAPTSKAAPKRAAAKNTKTPARKAAKPVPAKAAKTKAAETKIEAAAQTRRQRSAKGRRAPAFERGPNFGAETRDGGYVYERDTRDTARVDGETNDTYAPDDLAPGQVGEAQTVRRGGRRGSRGVSARPRDSETESVTVESGAAAAVPAKGGFEEDSGSPRESEIAGTQRSAGADKSTAAQDYGRPKTGDGKPSE